MAGQVGIVTKKYISSTAFLDQREILNKILDITNEEASFLDVMEMTNRSQPTAVPQYSHFVNEELYVLGTVSAVTGSTTTAVTATIDATAAAYVNEGEEVLFNDAKVGYVYSVSGNNIVVHSVDASTLTVATGDKISFFSNAAGEGSLSPDAKRWGQSRLYNQVQSFKAQYEITDIQKASKVEVDYQGKPFILYKGQHESFVKFRADVSNALWFSRMSTTTFGDTSPSLVDAEGNPVQTTGGLNQIVSTYGINQSVLTSGEVNLDDIADLIQTMNANRCPDQYMLFVGTEKNIQFDNLFSSLGNSAILSQAARFDVGGKNLDLGFDSVRIYGRTFHKKYLPIIDQKNVINFVGGPSSIYNAAYMAPATKVKTVDGAMLDRLGIRYMDAGNGTGLYRETTLGGLAPVPTNERSVLEIHYSSIQGLQVLGSQQFVKLV